MSELCASPSLGNKHDNIESCMLAVGTANDSSGCSEQADLTKPALDITTESHKHKKCSS